MIKDTSNMTCGEGLLHLLKAYGVDTAFGIPGYHTVEFYRNFDKMNIRQVTPRHEQGSAYGAYGYAAATGKPGCCFLVTGAGVANATFDYYEQCAGIGHVGWAYARITRAR
jgi:acetolactate synthase-1/2/3 large subunit